MRDEISILFILITAACWCVFYGYWLVKARSTKDNVYVQGFWGILISRVGILAVFVLLYFPRLSTGWMGLRVLPKSYAIGIAADILCAAGVSFALWARAVLGSNWSGAVTIKKDHEIITRGPYRVVRHPIYTGYLFATLGSALAVGEIRAVIALAMIVGGIIRKAGVEESLLSGRFPDTYPAYKKRTKKLIPFII